MRRYIRTCTCCDYELVSRTEPKDKTSNSFRNRRCPKCKSEAFDYGSWSGYDTQPWRDKWKALTGRELDMPEDELDSLIYNMGEDGLFEGNEMYNKLIELNY